MKTMKTDLPNLLTASSILLGIITALYSLFYGDIMSSLEVRPEHHNIDNEKKYKDSKNTLKTKYLPLLICSLVITLINIPELFAQLKNSFIAIKECGIENTTYDILSATYIVVCLFMIYISIIIITTGLKLKKKIKKLNPDK